MKSPLVKGIGEVVTDYGTKIIRIFKKGLLGRSLFDFYGDIKANALRVKESTNVPTTPFDKEGGVLYVKSSDGKLFYKSNEVSETDLTSEGVSNINDLTIGTTSLAADQVVFELSSSPTVNQIIKFDGGKFILANEGDNLDFTWSSVFYNNNTSDFTDNTTDSDLSSTQLIQAGNHITQTTVTLTFANSSSSNFTSGNQSDGGNTDAGFQTKQFDGSFTDKGALTYTTSPEGAATSTISHTLAYPTDLSSDSTNILKVNFFNLTNSFSHQLKYTYKNYAYLGKHTDDSPSDAELRAFQFKIFVNNGSTASNISAKNITLNSTSQHLQFWMPSRITSTPIFSVGTDSASLNVETWTAISGDINHTNASSNGFQENYKGFKSPNPLDNTTGVSTFAVKVTFS